jgi:hypothetical protein
MRVQYLLDENLSPLYQEQLRRYQPELTVVMVGELSDINIPTKGTLDPEILIWCETNNFILVTNNRTSMPVHLAEHLSQHRQVPGIFVLRPKATIGQIIEDLILIALVGEPQDYQNRITYIPL